MVGIRALEIKEVEDDSFGISYLVYYKENLCCRRLPHYCLAPHFPEEKPETIEVDGKIYLKSDILNLKPIQ